VRGSEMPGGMSLLSRRLKICVRVLRRVWVLDWLAEESPGKVAKGAVRGSRFEGSQGFEDDSGSNGNAKLIPGAIPGGAPALVGDAWWVEGLTQGFDMIGHWSYWEGGLNTLIAGAVVIQVNEGLGLGAGIGVGGKFCWVGIGCGGGYVLHLVVEGSDVAFSEKTEAGSDSLVEVLRFRRLGRVK
jgi:hypothetical protein